MLQNKREHWKIVREDDRGDEVKNRGPRGLV